MKWENEEQNRNSLMFIVLITIVNCMVFPERAISLAMEHIKSATKEFTNISAANAAEYLMIEQILSLIIFVKTNLLLRAYPKNKVVII